MPEFDDTPSKIIQAALALFNRVGFARATTRQIAEAAGVNEVTLFRHFGNKHNLLLAAMRAFNHEGFSEHFEQYLTGDYAHDIEMMVNLQLSDMRQRFHSVRLALCEANQVPELREVLRTGTHENALKLAEYFQRQIAAGAIQPDYDAHLLAEAFAHLFASPVLMEQLLDMPHNADLSATLTRIFVYGTQRQSTKE